MNHLALAPHQTQEARILQSAVSCIENSSLLDFTMAAISKDAGLSMGSIYKHIQSKDDVLVALGVYSCQHFSELAHRLMTLPLPMCARAVAVQLIDPSHNSPYSFGSQLVNLLGNEAILRRASPGWVEKYLTHDAAVEDIFRQAFIDAADSGELVVDAEHKDTVIDEIMLAVWSLCVGHSQVFRQRNVRVSVAQQEGLNRHAPVVHALQRLVNTYPWLAPLTDELLDHTCHVLVNEGLRVG